MTELYRYSRKQEYKIIKHCIGVLGNMCAADENKIVDILTGYLWDEKEAKGIKSAMDKE